MTYVKNNLYWIANITKVEGYGSVPVEKTVDITVSRRFKKRGISWYSNNANPLLKLRLLELNKEWDHYWKERERNLPDMLHNLITEKEIVTPKISFLRIYILDDILFLAWKKSSLKLWHAIDSLYFYHFG